MKPKNLLDDITAFALFGKLGEKFPTESPEPFLTAIQMNALSTLHGLPRGEFISEVRFTFSHWAPAGSFFFTRVTIFARESAQSHFLSHRNFPYKLQPSRRSFGSIFNFLFITMDRSQIRFSSLRRANSPGRWNLFNSLLGSEWKTRKLKINCLKLSNIFLDFLKYITSNTKREIISDYVEYSIFCHRKICFLRIKIWIRWSTFLINVLWKYKIFLSCWKIKVMISFSRCLMHLMFTCNKSSIISVK